MAGRWAAELDRWADRIALVPDSGDALTYAALLAEADAFAARLGGGRRLVALGVRNDVASIAAYLGALRAGHAVLLLAAGGGAERILATFAPDSLWDAETGLLTAAAEPAGGLHPDLAVLLSTSGSTGSPKLVRLSDAAVAANAASIIAYLGIGPDERAATTLPFHYSYGLSVLNSHLMGGGSLAVTDMSVAHPDFGAFLERAGVTSLAGVPYTHELLAKTGLVERLPPTVRTLTQAGGRLAPERIRAIAELGAARGFRFVPMYGQTEATARMAYLPPELAAAHPDCIGGPIPGGAFRLLDEAGAEIAGAGRPGELVYSGPNVMMGYALERADLARGGELSELRTGDIAERTPEGLYRIVGRASRFAKIAGLRVGFDDVEALLRAEGLDPVVTGTDQLLVLHLGPGGTGREAEVAAQAAERMRLPEAAVVAVAGELPRLPSGKADYGAIRALGEACAREAEARLSAGVHPIHAGFRRAFNAPGLGLDASFQSLGGDSLTYVNAAIAVEKALGQLPHRWEEMPIRALVALAEDRPAVTAGAAATSWSRIPTDTLVRVLALVFVIIGHAAVEGTEALRGGATVLMLLAGFSFARFQRHLLEQGQAWTVVRGSLERVILPYYLVMVPMLLGSAAERSWGWFALMSTWTVTYRGPLFAFWFLEALFHALLLTVLLFALPPVRRLSVERPFLLGLLLYAVAVLLWLFMPERPLGVPDVWGHRIDHHYWLYAVGVLAAVAGATWQRLLVLALAAGMAAVVLGHSPQRAVWMMLALAAVMFAPQVALPGRMAGLVLRVAAASYFIYVMHVPLHHVVAFELGLRDQPLLAVPLLLGASLVAGLLFDRAWSWLIILLRGFRDRRAAA